MEIILALIATILLVASVSFIIDNYNKANQIDILLKELDASLFINKSFYKSFQINNSIVKYAEPEAYSILENDDIYQIRTDKDFNYNYAILVNMVNYLLKKEYKRKNNITENNTN